MDPMGVMEMKILMTGVCTHQTEYLNQPVSLVFVAVHQDGLLVLTIQTIKFALTHHNPKVTSRINDVILIY